MLPQRRIPAFVRAMLVGLVVASAACGAVVVAQGGGAAQPLPGGAAVEQGIDAAPGPGMQELHEAFIRLPLAAALGAVLALRPRHRARTRRNALVIQTQIMLAVVGAVIMLVVGQSLARAFGIVGAANLIRYRSTIDDPKDAVVMLCALAAGLAAGVGLYRLAPFATIFMAATLWLVEYFEPAARRRYELKVAVKDAGAFRPRLEGALTGFALPFELVGQSDEELTYVVHLPPDVRTFDVADTIRVLAAGAEMSLEWDEKRSKD
ncbi:MAG: MgtC/SapB family protein [Acidobacteria bacterium]|nr:MgtC/SapB family protein [Acidobacteriota bacterium]